MRRITDSEIEGFKKYLNEEERSPSTVERYLRDVTTFEKWLGEAEVCKGEVVKYKSLLCKKYASSSVNTILSSLNGFFNYLEWFDLKIKTVRVQRQMFCSAEKELTLAEYERLLDEAKGRGKEKLFLLLQTICSTGIRISELRFITVESVRMGVAEIQCKGKRRIAFLPTELCKMLQKYTKKAGIESGSVFVTRSGIPLDRSNVWSSIKRLCRAAGVAEEKGFPHNLRHLFARTYYKKEKDIVRLADILGHSSVNTTRIYTMESGEVHRKQIQKLGLLRATT